MLIPMDTMTALSWGRAHRGPQEIRRPHWQQEAGALAASAGPYPRLARGLGRSYGDSCLNFGGTLIETQQLDRLVAFDREHGLVIADPGLSLFALIDLCLKPNPDGSYWFPPVVPGTKFVSLGGAIANDIHGKNHHLAGTFGEHIVWLELVRSDGSLHRCSRAENPALFAATVGGLGLTGYISRIALQLQKVSSPLFDVEDVAIGSVLDFWDLAAESAERFAYTAAWIDCLALGEGLGRGIFSRARHAQTPPRAIRPPHKPALNVPFALPGWVLNPVTLRAFNTAYRARLGGPRRMRRGVSYNHFLFPLDGVGAWNRLYGPRGFFQYQCVVPPSTMRDAIPAMLGRIAATGQGSFLAVLKTFGPRPAAGLLSFPMEGATLALDFPNKGTTTLALLDSLDEILESAGGRLYPAKDGRMSAASFQRQYPGWRNFAQYKDPQFSSSFWRRVSGTGLGQEPIEESPAICVGADNR